MPGRGLLYYATEAPLRVEEDDDELEDDEEDEAEDELEAEVQTAVKKASVPEPKRVQEEPQAASVGSAEPEELAPRDSSPLKAPPARVSKKKRKRKRKPKPIPEAVGLVTAPAAPLAPRVELEDVALAVVGGVPVEEHPVAVYLARVAPGTRRSARQSLEKIAELLHATINTVRWEDLRYPLVAAIRGKLATMYAPSTANKMLSYLRGVLHECARLQIMTQEQYAQARDFEPVPGKTVKKGRMITYEEQRKLFGSVDPGTIMGARNLALLAIMFGAGLRRSEAAALSLSDLSKDENGSWLTVHHGKGNKERRVAINDKVLLGLDAWLKLRGDRPGPLLQPIDRYGHTRYKFLTDQAVYWILNQIREEASVDSFSPHDIRRTFISQLLKLVDISTVSGLVGHESIETTAEYDLRGEEEQQKAAAKVDLPIGGL